MFTERKIEKFTKTVGGLPDQPNMEPQTLKNWFDVAPEELRQSLNGVCEDGARLEQRVDGIIGTTFPDAIREDMLSRELAVKLNGKAEGSALTAEQTARVDADTALDGRTSALEGKMATVLGELPLKSGIVFGSYTGDNAASRDIVLGFRPKIVLISCYEKNFYENIGGWNTYYGGLFADGTPLLGKGQTAAIVTDTGFRIFWLSRSIGNTAINIYTNTTLPYFYLAVR